jgi:hypothetical protein
MMPDFYTNPALYRHGAVEMDAPSIRAVLGAKGNPDAGVWIFRAVPAGTENRFNPGDWASTSLAYAKSHGESIDGDVLIISRQVRAGDLWTEGNSINEWGYWPT